jgi:hypothetical protein
MVPKTPGAMSAKGLTSVRLEERGARDVSYKIRKKGRGKRKGQSG